jgi:hypothetical protein
MPILLLLMGIISMIYYSNDIYFPIGISIIIYVLTSVCIIYYFSIRRVGALIVFIWIAYLLPFIHIIPYLTFNYKVDDVSLIWSLAVNPYMSNENIIMLTAMIGAVGAMGFLLGVSLENKKILPNKIIYIRSKNNYTRTMIFPVWILWVLIGVSLSWLSAPQETIFVSQYTNSQSLLQGFNFGSAWLVSYIILLFSLSDTIFEKEIKLKIIKTIIVIMAIIYVVLILQLLRGDRESITLVIAVFLVYFYWMRNSKNKTKFGSTAIIMMGGFSILVISWSVGQIRSTSVGLDAIDFVESIAVLIDFEGNIVLPKILYGTWTGVMLTPLSVAGDYLQNILPMKYGEDYMNFILSIPPGFLSDAVGYVRPIDASSGPAFDMKYGLGGNHAVTVPFMNFRIYGVFFIITIWSYLLTKFEKKATNHLTTRSLTFLSTFVVIAPHWLWYGEKYIMNAVIIWFILGWMHQISTKIGIHKKVMLSIK